MSRGGSRQPRLTCPNYWGISGAISAPLGRDLRKLLFGGKKTARAVCSAFLAPQLPNRPRYLPRLLPGTLAADFWLSSSLAQRGSAEPPRSVSSPRPKAIPTFCFFQGLGALGGLALSVLVGPGPCPTLVASMQVRSRGPGRVSPQWHDELDLVFAKKDDVVVHRLDGRVCTRLL